MTIFRWLGAIAILLAASVSIPAAEARTSSCAIAPTGKPSAVTVPGTGRSLILYLPAGLAPGKPAPLILLFHGSGGSARAVLDKSRLAETADRNGFIIAAADGGIAVKTGFVWNIPGVPAVGGRMPIASDADDVGFVGQAIDWLIAQRCVDRSRVYATGISGGGRMTSWLGCVDAGRFAAIAPVVGLRAGNPLAGDPTRPDPATCRPSRPMPILAFAGDADTTNPITGGGSPYWQYPMRAAEARWAELNACKIPIASRSVASDVYEEGYTGCRDNADVRVWVTIGGRHDWVVDNDAMWAFFATHRR